MSIPKIYQINNNRFDKSHFKFERALFSYASSSAYVQENNPVSCQDLVTGYHQNLLKVKKILQFFPSQTKCY